MPDVYGMSDEQRRQLGQLDQTTAARMTLAYTKLLDQAHKDHDAFQAKLTAWKAANPSMDPRGASPSRHWVFQEERYQNLITQLNTNLGFYAAISSKAMTDAQRRSMEQARGDVPANIAASMGGDSTAQSKLSMAILPEQAITAVVGFASDGTPLNALLAKRSRDAGSAAAATLVDGVAFGRSPAQMATTLDGQLNELHWQNLRLARTETMRAYREGTRVNMLQNADILSGWRWSSAADARSCAVCLSQQGQVFPIQMVKPSDVPPDTAQHKGLGDIMADPPKKAATLPPKELVPA